MLDLGLKDIETLTRYCDWGVKCGMGQGNYWHMPLPDHPMGQWAYELGIKGSRI